MKRRFTTTIVLPIAGVVLSVAFQNCGPGALQTSNHSSTSYNEANGEMETIEEKSAVGVNYSENILTAMLHLTGVSTPSTMTTNSYNEKKSKISETGRADTVTAPMWMSVTNLAGDVCLDLVNQEKPLKAEERRIFSKVDFAVGPSALSTAIKNDVIRRMARSFWGRNETTQEKTVLRSAIDEAFSNTANTGAQTEAAMLFTCSAMLASLDAQKQ